MDKRKINYQNLIAGIVMLIFSVFFYISTFGTRSFMFAAKGSVPPDAIPKAVAIAMFVLGLCIIGKWMMGVKKGSEFIDTQLSDGDEDTSKNSAEGKKRLCFQKITMPITLVLIFLYIWSMPTIGFTVATILYLTLQITLLSTDLSPKSWLKNAIIAVIAGVVIFLVFGKAFNLTIPLNSFGF